LRLALGAPGRPHHNERKTMGTMQKRKGRSGEQELARLLRDELGDQVARNLEQASESGLQTGPARLAVHHATRSHPPGFQRRKHQHDSNGRAGRIHSHNTRDNEQPMTPQDEFKRWYQTAMGITVEEASRRRMTSVKMMRAAFMAGRESGRIAKDKETPPAVREFWEMTMKTREESKQ